MCSGRPRVSCRGLRKDFRIKSGEGTTFGVLKGLLRPRDRDGRRVRALDNVSFDLEAGELVGVIGNNGGGKTTLLKLVAGIYRPTAGSLEVNGDLVLLSGLGIGMLPDLSVRENVFLYGAICRLSRARLAGILDEIIDWAELPHASSVPLRTLSTGMKARLAFAVSMFADAQILLLDEALSAGDQRFERKCNRYFETLQQSDTALLAASHDMGFVTRFCSKTLWLRDGEQAAFGPTDDVLPEYVEWAS